MPCEPTDSFLRRLWDLAASSGRSGVNALLRCAMRRDAGVRGYQYPWLHWTRPDHVFVFYGGRDPLLCLSERALYAKVKSGEKLGECTRCGQQGIVGKQHGSGGKVGKGVKCGGLYKEL